MSDDVPRPEQDLLAILNRYRRRHARRFRGLRRKHLCRRCRYDLRGARSARCPECGASIEFMHVPRDASELADRIDWRVLTDAQARTLLPDENGTGDLYDVIRAAGIAPIDAAAFVLAVLLQGGARPLSDAFIRRWVADSTLTASAYDGLRELGHGPIDALRRTLPYARGFRRHVESVIARTARGPHALELPQEAAAVPIVIVAYDDGWARRFEHERSLLADVFTGTEADIEHVGSTAVAGLAAKPIIDIIIGVTSLIEVERRIGDLEALEYQYIREYEIQLPQRRYFRKPRAADATHHLHAVVRGSDFWERHLAFRDYLRSHPEAVQAYVELKRKLAARHQADRVAYTEGKSDFIERILDLAATERDEGVP